MRKSITSNDFGNISLSSCGKITIKELKNRLHRETKRLLQDMFPEGKIISRRCNYGGERYLFLCPLCQRQVFTLYEDPFRGNIACRHCIGYHYQKQRFKGMPEERIGK